MDKIVAFLPCRKGSQRVKNKNIRTFAGIEGGLTHIKLSQLLSVEEIDQIIVSTNDKEIMRIALSFESEKILIDTRPEALASSEASTDDLTNYVPKIIESNSVLWTHVTSPFVTAELYSKIIKEYFDALDLGYDSLMTVAEIHGFLWDNKGSINYDRAKEKWPRTQTIAPVYEINSAVFLNSINNYKKYSDRIGQNPFLSVLNKYHGFDIDWEEDFVMAECLLEKEAGKI